MNAYNPMQPVADILDDPYCPIPGTYLAARMDLGLKAQTLVQETVRPFRWIMRRMLKRVLDWRE